MKRKTGAVILAAGISDISKTGMLKQELDTLREAGVAPIAVVIGHDEEGVRKELAHRKVIFVENPRYKTTKMFASIQLGLKALKGHCDRVIIVNGDSPSFSKATLLAISEVDNELTFPMHEGKPGHPFCIDMEQLDNLLSYDGRNGIQGMMKKGLIKAGLVSVDDPGIHMEAKEEKSLRKVLKYQQDVIQSDPIRPEISFSLSRADQFFSEELAALLREIDKCHSMNNACKDLNMAYSRGWKMIKKAEEMLGCSLITKQVGGSKGGGSVLTEEGRRHLSNYEDLREEIIAFAQKVVGDKYK